MHHVNLTLYFYAYYRKEAEIKNMKETAEQAIQASAEAYEITKDAVNQQKNIR